MLFLSRVTWIFIFSVFEVRISHSTRRVAEEFPQSDLRLDTEAALNFGKERIGQHSAVV